MGTLFLEARKVTRSPTVPERAPQRHSAAAGWRCAPQTCGRASTCSSPRSELAGAPPSSLAGPAWVALKELQINDPNMDLCITYYRVPTTLNFHSSDS